MTKEEKRLYDISYRKKNKKRIAEKRRAYRGKTKKQKQAYDKVYYQSHIENKRSYGRKYSTLHREKRKPYFKNWCLIKKYGITSEQVSSMTKSQSGKCALCRNKFQNESDICVDHDHKLGRIRELLCKRCNLGIGQLHEDPNLLLRAHDYLIKWRNTK